MGFKTYTYWVHDEIVEKNKSYTVDGKLFMADLKRMNGHYPFYEVVSGIHKGNLIHIFNVKIR